MAFLSLVPLRVWLWLGMAVVLTTGGAWIHHRIDHAGYVRGTAEIQGKWDKQRAADAEAVNQWNEKVRQAERERDQRIAAIGDWYAKQTAEREVRHQRDLAALRDGSLRLRIPGACAAQAGADRVQAPAEGSHGAADGELPEPLARSLLELAADADRNTEQLSACQAVINSYQEKKQ